MPELTLGMPLGAGVAQIGPLGINRLSRAQAIDMLRTSQLLRIKMDVAICNAHTVLQALDHPEYAETLSRMTLFNDGIGVDIAARAITGKAFPANLNGTDLVPAILENIGLPLRIYLLGAKPSSVAGAAEYIAAHYPQHHVAGFHDGYFTREDRDAVIARINAANVDLLLVGMGNPAQERFIVENRDKLNPTICIGVGALFDFLSGEVVRAPRFLQAAGLEWLFRLMQEPRRLGKRYTVGIYRFLSAVLRLRAEARRDRPGGRAMPLL
ncbi:WecB/TagA/CpsF family glycosyltransferase [Pannonibacter sp. Q-1]|uniref:WecB/TagA/CpsF family glycosyltransferase n=2 Tax=Pannonibacter phragmitetus TaxID=121719 RepID=UPI001AD92E5D|nr:WecB/TagA/CpsF family glycosyltransferase [Pannonibacter phragmitetus]